MSAIRSLIRSTSILKVPHSTHPCLCRIPSTSTFSPLQFLSISSPSIQSRSYASKKKGGSGNKSSKQDKDEVELEDDYQPVKGKGVKKSKGGGFTNDDNSSTGGTGGGNDGEGLFDLKVLEKSMDEAVDKLRIGLKTVVGRVGRVSPDLLDGVKVEIDGKRRPLSEFASVSVKDGKDLLVTVYEEESVVLVSKALYASSLNLTPQPTSPTTLRIPIPRPDWDKRQELVRKASEICENARVSVRSVRGKGQKDIKGDVDSKIIGKEDSRNEVKKLDTSTKKRTDEVDGIFEKAKKVLMDE